MGTKKIIDYNIGFKPGTNEFKIEIIIEGHNDWIHIPIETKEEFICIALILQSNNSAYREDGVIMCTL